MRASRILAVLLLAAGCKSGTSSKPDARPGTEPDANGGNQIDGGNTGGPDAASGAAGDAMWGPDAEPSGVSACTHADLVAGDPVYEGDQSTGISTKPLGDSPIAYRQATFYSESGFYTAVGQEVWAVDFNADTQKRIAGVDQGDGSVVYGPGTCASAGIADSFGSALFPDGSLIVADNGGNGLLRVSGIGTGNCKVDVYAGYVPPTSPEDETLGDPPNVGDGVGPGVGAELGQPEWPVIDRHSNVYFIDTMNDSVKKIAPDAPHTITRVATNLSSAFQGDDSAGFVGMTLVGLDDAYLIANSSLDSWIIHVNLKTGAEDTVVHGGGSTFNPLTSDTNPDLSAITSDTAGNVYVYGSGYVWKVPTDSTAGATFTALAGNGEFPDGDTWGLPEGGTYDPTAEQTALGVYLPNDSGDLLEGGTSSYLSIIGGTVYVVGNASVLTGDNFSYYVEAVCTP